MNAIAPSSAPVSGPSLDNRRVLAGLVDLAVVGVGSALLSTLISAAGGSPSGSQMGLVTVAWALYYYFALESGDGQTLGKKLMKLRVMRADGGRTGMQEIAVRTVLRVVDGMALYLVGLVVMLVTGKRRQRLGDIAAGTVVVDASSSPAPVAVAPAVAFPPPPVPDVAAPEAPAYPVSTPVDIGSPLPGMTAPEDPVEPAYNPSSAELAPQPESPAPAPDYPGVEPAEQPSPEPAAEAPEPEEPAYQEPVAEAPETEAPAYPVGTPVDVGSPLPDLGTPEPPAAPLPDVATSEPPTASTYNPSTPAPTYNPSSPGVPPMPPASAPDYPSVEPAAPPSVEPAAVQPAFGHGVEEPLVEEPAVEPDSPDADEDAADEDQMTVKAVETVSAMDLIMGDENDENPGPPAQGDAPAGA